MSKKHQPLSRRVFLSTSAVLGAGPSMGQSSLKSQVAKRPLGRTGVSVSILGIGGFHLGAAKDQEEADQLVQRALDAGIKLF